MTKTDIFSIKNRIEVLRNKQRRSSERYRRERDAFQAEIEAIQDFCSHPDGEQFMQNGKYECSVCEKKG